LRHRNPYAIILMPKYIDHRSRLAETSVHFETWARLAKYYRTNMWLFTASKIHIKAFFTLCCNGFQRIVSLTFFNLVYLEHTASPFILFKEA